MGGPQLKTRGVRSSLRPVPPSPALPGTHLGWVTEPLRPKAESRCPNCAGRGGRGWALPGRRGRTSAAPRPPAPHLRSAPGSASTVIGRRGRGGRTGEAGGAGWGGGPAVPAAQAGWTGAWPFKGRPRGGARPGGSGLSFLVLLGRDCPWGRGRLRARCRPSAPA